MAVLRMDVGYIMNKVNFWAKLIFMSIVLIVIGSVIFCSGCAATWQFLVTGTPLQAEIRGIQNNASNCLRSALDIGKARYKAGLPTTIVIAYSYDGWHAFYRDENGALGDTTRIPVLATPMFEFDYVNCMNVKWGSGNDVYIYVGSIPYIAFEVVPQWPKYNIIEGEDHVRKLRESAAMVPQGAESRPTNLFDKGN